MGLIDSLEEWVEQGNEGEWSFTNPTDAQRESFIFLACSFVVILLLWQGKIPYWVKVRYMKNKVTGDVRRKIDILTFPLPLLTPFKVMTVLYHEISHAVVGKATILYQEMQHGINKDRGRVLYIMVDIYEGGRTEFAGEPKPIEWLTLPAGYLGSCLFGCWFLFTGFDAKWSKFGALSLLVLTLLSIVSCVLVRSKSGLKHQWHRIAAFLYRWFLCDRDMAEKKMRQHHYAREVRNEQAVYRHEEDPDGPTELDLHASQELITGCSLLLLALIVVAWNWDDSIWLRFFMLFMGMLSAAYAVWDIIQDGIKYAKVAQSDATRMAELYNEKRREKTGLEGDRSTRYYATVWLLVKLTLILLVLLSAYYAFKRTRSEQAIESREFMPAQFSYGPADLKADASYAGDKIEGTVDGWLGND